MNREKLAEEKAAKRAIEAAEKEKRIKDAEERAAKAKEARQEAVKKVLEAQKDRRFKDKVEEQERERQRRAEETKKKREAAARDLAGREARQRRREEQEAAKRKRKADRLKKEYNDSPEGRAAAAAAAAAEAEAAASNVPRVKTTSTEQTRSVYRGVWQMPCDIKKEPWCEVRVKVMERQNPYRLRFEGKVKLMWTTELGNEEDGTVVDLSRSAKYTVTELQLQQVLLPAFDTEVMSPIAARRQTTASGTSTYGGKRSAESAMFRWAQSGFAPLRARVIQWILRRMRVGVGLKSLVLILSEEMTESYAVDRPGKGRKRTK